jgi:hypothetical protein
MKCGLIVVSLVLVSVATAQAQTTCKQRADNCVSLSRPETKEACHESSRMAQCKASGQYVAPTGRVWEANKR